MKSIQLHTDMPRNITMIPNEFLDHYMSGANGEFLKIYLYLLRWAGFPETEITTSSIADFFNMTENDVKRALRFWEQERLLRIAWDRPEILRIYACVRSQRHMLRNQPRYRVRKSLRRRKKTYIRHRNRGRPPEAPSLNLRHRWFAKRKHMKFLLILWTIFSLSWKNRAATSFSLLFSNIRESR